MFINEDDVKQYDYLEFDKLPPGIEFVVRKSTNHKKEERFLDVASLKKYFNAAVELLLNENSEQSYRDIINELKLGKTDADFLDNFARQLSLVMEQPDEIQDIFMSFTPEQFVLFSSHYPDLALRGLEKFKELIISQGWPFSFTDTIGRQCYQLYISTNNTHYKAILLYAIVEVGAHHHRWYVMGLARELLIDIKEASVALEIASYLEPLSWELNKLDIGKIDVVKPLKDLFKV